jgi:hypothetical protein
VGAFASNAQVIQSAIAACSIFPEARTPWPFSLFPSFESILRKMKKEAAGPVGEREYADFMLGFYIPISFRCEDSEGGEKL